MPGILKIKGLLFGMLLASPGVGLWMLHRPPPVEVPGPGPADNEAGGGRLVPMCLPTLPPPASEFMGACLSLLVRRAGLRLWAPASRCW